MQAAPGPAPTVPPQTFLCVVVRRRLCREMKGAGPGSSEHTGRAPLVPAPDTPPLPRCRGCWRAGNRPLFGGQPRPAEVVWLAPDHPKLSAPQPHPSPRGCTPAALAPHACPPGAQALGTQPLTPFPKPTSGPSRPCPHWGARSQLPAPPRGPRPWLQPAPHSPFCGLLNCPGCHLAPGQSLCPLKALPMTPPCTRRLTVPHSGALSCCPLSPEITGSQRAQNRLPVTAAGQSEAQAARGVDGRLLEPTGAGAAAWGPRAVSCAGDAAEAGRTWPYRRPGLAGALPGPGRSRTVSCPLAVLAQTTSGWVAWQVFSGRQRPAVPVPEGRRLSPAATRAF